MWSGIWRSDGGKTRKNSGRCVPRMDGGDAPAFFVAGNSGWDSFPLARGSGRKWREVAWTASFPDQAAVKGSLEKMRKKRRVTAMARTTRRFRRTEPPFR